MFSETSNLPQNLLDIDTIYLEPTVENYARGKEILAQFPDATRIEVPSHWQIAGLNGNEGNASDWLKIKRNILVLGVRKAMKMDANGRSSDFIAPSTASGCAMACAYCVAPGTLISTPLGPKPVEQIRDGDEVTAFDNASGQLVTARTGGLASRQVSQVLEIEVGDTTLRVSEEHPLMTRRGWVKAKDLTPDDELLRDERGELQHRKIKSIKRIEEPTMVYNFHVPGPESYLANGIVTHNCYVPRHKGFANPITTFVNIEQISAYIARHAGKQGFKMTPTAPDDDAWIYEIGCNSDVSVDAAICDNTRDLIEMFRTVPNAKATFATKWVNREMLAYDPQGKTRIRFSLMPREMAKLVDVRTSPVRERIAAINDFVEAGYEVNVNFSPVIVKEGFLDDYDALFEEVDAALSPAAKAQMKAEIIFLTHHQGLHEVNLQWHPKAEEVLWTPESQENKISQMGGSNVRYKVSLKQPLVKQFCERMQAKMPYCGVRYAF